MGSPRFHLEGVFPSTSHWGQESKHAARARATPRPGAQDGLLLWAAEKHSLVFLAVLGAGSGGAACLQPAWLTVLGVCLLHLQAPPSTTELTRGLQRQRARLAAQPERRIDLAVIGTWKRFNI